MLKSFNALRFTGSTHISLLIWVLTLLSLPILGWILGEGYLQRGMSVGVLVQALAGLVILYNAWGWRRTIFVFVVVAGLAYLAELLGVTTGFPFGKYHYTSLLQPQVAGVPLLIPLAWMMMLPPAWAVAHLITARDGRNFSFLIVSALAFTAWDLFLDPQMAAWHFWVWEVPGQYYGIPWSNYLGWLVVSICLTLIANPRHLPAGPLSLVYVLTWLLQTIGQGIFWQQPGPAFFGFIGSGIFIVFAILRRGKPVG
ncbi:MAG: carotenoid biosynthesis protein [Chloroflexota bacterium]